MEEESGITAMNFEQKITKATKTERTPIRGFPGSATVPVASAGVPPADSARPAFPPFAEQPLRAFAGPRERIPLCYLRFLLLKSVFVFFLLPFAVSTFAQAPPQTGNRFLFIINTSSAMRRMTNGIREAVFGLLNSGMQGQMREGDTFGIWTYDDQLHAGFPMQVWSNQNKSAILQTVSNCLAEPRYEAKPHLEKALPAARQLVEQSRVVTLIFILDGSETMQGTGFDQDINDLHKEFGRQMRADNIPFVTALAAHDGKVFDYRVRTPASVSLPPTADYFKPAETNAVPVVAAATNPPPPAVVASQLPEPRRREIVLRPEPPPATNPPSFAASVPAQPIALEKPEPVLQPDTRSGALASAAVIQPEPTPPIQPAPTSAQPAPMPVQTPPPIAAPANAPTNPQSAMGSRTPANPQSHEEESTEVNKDNEGEHLPPSLPSLPSVQNPQSAIRNPQLPPPAVAVALPAPANHRALLAAGISLLATAVVLCLLLVRRSRAAPSLISQSMDRAR
jgi:hypothetical protein